MSGFKGKKTFIALGHKSLLTSHRDTEYKPAAALLCTRHGICQGRTVIVRVNFYIPWVK